MLYTYIPKYNTVICYIPTYPGTTVSYVIYFHTQVHHCHMLYTYIPRYNTVICYIPLYHVQNCNVIYLHTQNYHCHMLYTSILSHPSTILTLYTSTPMYKTIICYIPYICKYKMVTCYIPPYPSIKM